MTPPPTIAARPRPEPARRPRRHSAPPRVFGVALVAALSACTTPPAASTNAVDGTTSSPAADSDDRGRRDPEVIRGSSGDTVPVAFFDDRPVRRGDLETALVEYGGGVVLREHLLDLRLAKLAASRGIAVDDSMVARELDLLRATLDPDPDRAVELLDAVRARQGLGDVRFEALLRRNAMLRALVAGEIRPDENAIERIHDVRHGPRRQVRVIASPSLAEAEAVARELADGGEFAELAYRRSTDPSRSAGGLVPPVTRLDPTWPAAFREVVFELEVGEISAPVLVGDAWVTATCLAEAPGDGTPIDAVRADLEPLARLQQERVRMDRLVRELDAGLDPRVLDPSLRDAWRRTRP